MNINVSNTVVAPNGECLADDHTSHDQHSTGISQSTLGPAAMARSPSDSLRLGAHGSAQPSSSTDNQHQQLIPKCLVLSRQSNGFGLTVSGGEHPFLVKTVTKDGAADCAGLCEGDRFVSVGGIDVRKISHSDLVKALTTGQTVVVKVLGRQSSSQQKLSALTTQRSQPSSMDQAGPSTMSPQLHDRNKERKTSAASSSPISPPAPPPKEKQAEFRNQRVQLLMKMCDDEKLNRENLLKELKIEKLNPSKEGVDQLETKINQANKRISVLQHQLTNATDSGAVGEFIGSMNTLPGPQKNNIQHSDSNCSTASAPEVRQSKSKIPKSPAGAQSHPSGLSSNNALSPTINKILRVHQVDIPPMEESESDTEESLIPLEVDGPFANVADLQTHQAHLAVFLHYLMSNSDPASLLFYLISGIYQSSGNGTSRDTIKRWAYEIYSTFLLPNSPMCILHGCEDVCEAIDQVLTNGDDIQLSAVFVKARQLAVDEVSEHLADFRQKRALGLGSVFGEHLLADLTDQNRTRQLKVVDKLLSPHFETLYSSVIGPQQPQALLMATDYDHLNARFQALGSSLATVFKLLFALHPENSLYEKLLDKTPTFVTKEKNWMVKKIKEKSKDRKLALSGCSVCLHKQCATQFEQSCSSGAGTSSGRRRPHSTILPGSPHAISGSISHYDIAGHENRDRPTAMKCPKAQVPGPVRDPSAGGDSGYGEGRHEAADEQVKRSHSVRTQDDILRQSKRHMAYHAGGTAGRRAKSDVDTHEHSVNAAGNSSSTPNSSVLASDSNNSLSQHQQTQDTDSDLEVEQESPALDSIVDENTLRNLQPKERKRQETLNELFHTERSHVRNLKVLWRVFCEPLQHKTIPGVDQAFVHLLFANLDEVLDLHCQIETRMQAARQHWRMKNKNALYGDIGEMMLMVLEGEAGYQFGDSVARFIQHQQHALTQLKHYTNTCQPFAQFLQQAEENPVCRKLQLKDMLPMEMMRLTKYPLLLDLIAKYTHEPSPELDKLKRSIELSRQILETVNKAKHDSESIRRLDELQTHMDSSLLDKEQDAMSRQYRGIDLRQHKLIKDGQLTWKLGKNKLVDVQVVLLDGLLVLLARQTDGRFLLRAHTNQNNRLCPILRLSSLIATEVATNKKALFIVPTSVMNPQIYELVAQVPADRRAWFKALTEQIDICKERDASQLPLRCDNRLDDDGESERHAYERTQESLVGPSEINILQPEVLNRADTVLTPMERLSRADKALMKLLVEKQQLLTEFMCDTGGPNTTNPEHTDAERLQALTDSLAVLDVPQLKSHTSTHQVILAAIVQANRLLEAINEGIREEQERAVELKEQRKEALQSGSNNSTWAVSAVDSTANPNVPCVRLTTIAMPLMKHLTALLSAVQNNEAELKNTKEQLNHYRELYEQSQPSERKASLTQANPTLLAVAKPSASTDVTSKPPTVDSNALPPPPPSCSPPPDSDPEQESDTITNSGNSKRPDKLPLPTQRTNDAKVKKNSEEKGVKGGGEVSSTPSTPDSPRNGVSSDEQAKRQRRMHKRQRNTALTLNESVDNEDKPKAGTKK